jgi:MFS family permease
VPFAIASVMFSLAIIPIALSRTEQPNVAIARFRPVKVFRLSPVGMIAVACGGMMNGALWAFAPVFAIGKGATPSEAALFMSVIMIGGALSLIVLGRFSDRMDRRVLLLGLMLAGLGASLLLTVSPGGALLFACAFGYGLATLPIYATASAHTYDRAAAGDYVETAASLMVANGIASVLGPVIAAVVVARAGSGAFFLLIGTVQLALALFILVRLRRRPAPAVKAPLDITTARPGPEAAVVDLIVDRSERRAG